MVSTAGIVAMASGAGVDTGWRDGGGRDVLLSWGPWLSGLPLRTVPTALPGAALVPDAPGTAVVFIAASVGEKDGPTNRGSVGTGEGVASETSEDADDGDVAVTNTVAVGMPLEKEDKTDMGSPVARRSPSEGDGVGERDDSVRGGVV